MRRWSRRTGRFALMLGWLLLNLTGMGFTASLAQASTSNDDSVDSVGGPDVEAVTNTYYVSTSGSDSNPGSSTAPFRTVQKGVSVLGPGDFLYVKSGIYHQTETIYVWNSGTANARITIATDPDDLSSGLPLAVISGDDGNGICDDTDAPSEGAYLIGLIGSYIDLRNLEVAFSGEHGIFSLGENNVVAGNNIHHIWRAGIWIFGNETHNAVDNVVENNTVWRTNESNYCSGANGSRRCNGDWSAAIAWGDATGLPGLPAAIAPNATIRHNTVHHNSGEGLLCVQTKGGVVEDNIVYDNWGLGIYLDQCSNITVQRNLAYYTPNTNADRCSNERPCWWRFGVYPSFNIMLANEGISGNTAVGQGRLIVNNILIGGVNNFRFWRGFIASGLTNDVIANNTFVETQGYESISLDAFPGISHSNTRIANNLILQSSGDMVYVENTDGLTFDHNLWSRTPPSNVSSSTDVIGDPMLADPDHTRIAGEMLADWYRLTASSPAVGSGVALSQVADDYFGSPRSTPSDIGAHEYNDAALPSPTFADVPFEHPFHEDIEILYQNGYTAGCNTGPLMYCPDNTMNRAESSVFVERGIHTATYDPAAPSSQVFADLGLDSWAANWVNSLWVDQYTAGCGTDPLIYCPWQGHTRAEGCVFYLRMLRGANYDPPEPTEQTFVDVPLGTWYAKWVQVAYDAGLIMACQTAPELRFCPDGPLTRGLAAYMMVQAKGLLP